MGVGSGCLAAGVGDGGGWGTGGGVVGMGVGWGTGVGPFGCGKSCIPLRMFPIATSVSGLE